MFRNATDNCACMSIFHSYGFDPDVVNTSHARFSTSVIRYRSWYSPIVLIPHLPHTSPACAYSASPIPWFISELKNALFGGSAVSSNLATLSMYS